MDLLGVPQTPYHPTQCGYSGRCGHFHVLGCPGHPFHPDYWRSATDEQRQQARVVGTKALYVAGLIDDAEMEHRIGVALSGGTLAGDPTRP